MNSTILYIDSGSGSYIIQVIIAILLGAGYSLKLYWSRFKHFFIKNPKTSKEDGEKKQ